MLQLRHLFGIIQLNKCNRVNGMSSITKFHVSTQVITFPNELILLAYIFIADSFYNSFH